MNETEEQLKKIEEFAGLFFHPEEIAILIKVDFDALAKKLRDKKSLTYKSYMMGKLNTVLEVRKNQVSAAKSGSPNAESIIDKLIREQNLAETNL